MKINQGFSCMVVVLLIILILVGCSKINDNTVYQEDSKNTSTNNEEITIDDNESAVSDLARQLGIDKFDNPIDMAFKKDFDFDGASSTPVLNYLANVYLDAWKMEWDNITSILMKQYHYEEDKNKIKNYKKSYEDFIERASELEWIDWSDTSVEPGENRTFGTGAISASTMEEAILFKRQVLYLINKYYPNEEYTFIYSENGAELEKLTGKNN
jgi:hypothetical protein